MKALWVKYAARIEALSTRERVIVFAAGLLIAVAIVYFAAIDPAQRRSRALLAQMERERTEIATLESQLRSGPKHADPDADSRGRAEALTAKPGVRKPDPGLEAKVLDLSAQVKVRQEIVGALKGGSVGTTAGFSEYMRHGERSRRIR